MLKIISIILSTLLWTILGAVLRALAPIIQMIHRGFAFQSGGKRAAMPLNRLRRERTCADAGV